jgi:hypothetical protein
METFRILYLRNNILEDAETVEGPNVFSAVDRACGHPPEVRVEVWRDDRRVAVIGPSRAADR